MSFAAQGPIEADDLELLMLLGSSKPEEDAAAVAIDLGFHQEAGPQEAPSDKLPPSQS